MVVVVIEGGEGEARDSVGRRNGVKVRVEVALGVERTRSLLIRAALSLDGPILVLLSSDLVLVRVVTGSVGRD